MDLGKKSKKRILSDICVSSIRNPGGCFSPKRGEGLEFQDNGIAGRNPEFFGGAAFGDGDFKFSVTVDQGEGAVIRGFGISA